MDARASRKKLEHIQHNSEPQNNEIPNEIMENIQQHNIPENQSINDRVMRNKQSLHHITNEDIAANGQVSNTK